MCSPVENFNSSFGHLPNSRNTIDVLNLVHNNSCLGYNDGALLMVDLLHEICLLHRSHLRVPLDHRHPRLELPRLPIESIKTTTSSVKIHPSQPNHNITFHSDPLYTVHPVMNLNEQVSSEACVTNRNQRV